MCYIAGSNKVEFFPIYLHSFSFPCFGLKFLKQGAHNGPVPFWFITRDLFLGRHCKSPGILCVGFMLCVLLLFRLGSRSGDALGSVV